MLLRFSQLQFPPRFWEIVDAGKQQQAAMEDALQGLTKEELEVFGNYFDSAVADLVQQVQGTGSSDPEDTQEIIAGWVLSQGKDKFAAIFDEPRLFPRLEESESDLDNVYYSNNYYGMPQTIYERKYRSTFPEFSQAMWEQAHRIAK